MGLLKQIADLKPVPAVGAAAAYIATLEVCRVCKFITTELNRVELDPAPQATPLMAWKDIERLYLDLERFPAEDLSCCLNFNKQAASGDKDDGKSAFPDIMTCSCKLSKKLLQVLNGSNDRRGFCLRRSHPA